MNIPLTFARNASNRTTLQDGTPRKRNGLKFLRNKNKRHYVWVQNIDQKPQFSCDILSENVPTGGRKCVLARCNCFRPECRGGWSDFVQRKSVLAKGVEIRRRLTGAPFAIASVTSVKVRNLTTMLDQQHPAPPHIQHHLGVGPTLDTSNHHHHDMFLGQLQQHHLVPAEPDCYGQPGPAPLPDDHHSSAVLGFVFPLATEDEIERLEISVKQSGIIRGQYVQYLNVTKPIHLSVVQSFSMFFSDYSMTNYSYYGVERAEYPKTPKKAMKKYEVFSSCMLEAWRSHGINGVILMEQLKKAIYHISRRRYTRNQVLKKKLKQLQGN
ncbi:uncharacterized protein LOC120418374 isoform X1 [Culex pipiens pallens]|nr:uncharacterized protein LOC120418374 isoform X1 [Culex pipiens pallens]